jgi:tetratricopeptide (TPR) repeat protein
MSEERQIPEYDPEITPDPIATGIAIGRASPAIDSEVIAFLRDQRLHLHEQFRHLREQLRLRLWEQRMGVFLRVATAIVGVAVASGFAYMVWDAAHSKGLIIEPFSVPMDFAQRGLTGEVVAGQMIDKLTTMTKSESSRAAQSYANNWGNNIKVEIPETGVSIGELRNFLREWLGHDIHASGDIYRTADGIAVTARASGEEGATFTGKEGDLDVLMQKAAEHVYEVTQPYRYANYLDRNYDLKGLAQRIAKATAVYRRLIAGDDPKEQAWAWNGLATIQFNFYADQHKSAWYYKKALAANPDFTLVYYSLSSRLGPLGQQEGAFRNTAEFVRRAELGTPELNPRYARSALASAKSVLLSNVGDFAAVIPIDLAAAESMDNFSVLARGNFTNGALSAMIRAHDLAATRGYLKALGWSQIPRASFSGRFWYAMDTDDWRPILESEPLLKAPTSQFQTSLFAKHVSAGEFTPINWAPVAYAHARTGDIAGAEKMLAPLAADNADGVQMRAMVAELKGDHARADWWFARAEAEVPSLPLTDLFWGQALLKRGQPDAAIAKFTRANKLGPKFADPLEGWGEALMVKNQSHLALAKFKDADKYAPNWGRLHLKWGEALGYAGRKDEARAQYQKASTLDLTAADRAELARVSAHG